MKKPNNAVLAGLLVAIIAITATTTTIVSIQPQQQLAYAIVPGLCPSCAKEFAPGQEKVDTDFESQSAKPFAPGQEAGIEPAPCGACNGSSELAPGQEAKIIGPE